MTYFSDARKAIEEMRKGNPRNVEFVIRFLEKDEYKFGTGYIKEDIWRNLKRVSLTESQKERIRKVAFQYLLKGMRREFWYMCRFIRHIANDTFQSQVQQYIKSEQADVKWKALIL